MYIFNDQMSTEGSNTEDDEEDPYDARIKKSGCAKYHYALQVILSWKINLLYFNH